MTKIGEQDFQRWIRQAVDDALRAEAERLYQEIRRGIDQCVAMRLICEARDPFFPREHLETEH